MSTYNLLKGTGKAVVDVDDYGIIYDTTEPLVIGKTYTISAYVDKIERSPLDRDSGPSPLIAVYDGGGWTGFGNLQGNVPGLMTLTFAYVHRYPDRDNPNRIGLFNTPPNGTGVKRKMSFHNLMLVEGTEPAAWAPAEGETLSGGGALMSANLLAEGDRRTGADGTTYADGVWSIPANGTSKDKNAANDWPTGTEAVTENQTFHVGLSVRAASGASVVVAPGVAYVDGAGNVNYVATRVSARGTGAWQRVEGSFVMPSGMRVSFLFVHQGAGGAALELTAPCLSYGSPVTLAISSTTLAWSAGIVATTRYYKLASATSSTPAVPTSSSALNGWSETEPTADVTKVMWVCERTVYADGTESWSKASKSTSYEAAKDAKSAANAAASTADSAKSAADRAQSTADAALDNAGTANGRVRAVEAKFSASIDGLDVRVRGVSEAVSAQGATVRDVERNMSFGLDGLVIGAADSASKVRITEKRETFEVDGKTVLALDGDTSTVEASALKIGGYVWTATNGGKNLTLVYRG